MNYVDSTGLIPLLIEVSRKKQGTEKLNWGDWLKIPENKYLFQINENIAKQVFEGTNDLIDRAKSNINLPTQRRELIESRRTSRIRGGSRQIIVPYYGIEFDDSGNQSVNTTFAPVRNASRTYSWWMKADVILGNTGVFGYGNNARESFHINFGTDGTHINKPLFFHGGGYFKAWEDTPQQDDGRWHHWVVFSNPLDIPSCRLYVDGTEIDAFQEATGGSIVQHTQPLNIGTSRNQDNRPDNHFEGSITNFAVFGGDVTDRVSTHYNKGIPINHSGEADLQGYWKFDENGGLTAADSSGNGNDGTLDNDPTWITVMQVEETTNESTGAPVGPL